MAACLAYGCPNKALRSYNYDVVVALKEEPLFKITVEFCDDHDIQAGAIVLV